MSRSFFPQIVSLVPVSWRWAIVTGNERFYPKSRSLWLRELHVKSFKKLSEIITHPAVFSDTTCVRHILQQFGSVRWWPRKRTKRLKVDPDRGKTSQNKCHYFVSMSYMTSSPVFCFRLAKKPRGHKNWAKIAQKGWLRILFLKGTIICLWH